MQERDHLASVGPAVGGAMGRWVVGMIQRLQLLSSVRATREQPGAAESLSLHPTITTSSPCLPGDLSSAATVILSTVLGTLCVSPSSILRVKQKVLF